MSTNLNEFAKKITLEEGLKMSISIAQAKEMLRIILKEFAKMDEEEVIKIVRRYKNK